MSTESPLVSSDAATETARAPTETVSPRIDPPVDPDALVEALQTRWNQLPEAAIRQCQAHRELVAPRLISLIEETTALARDDEYPEDNAHLIALLLLTEFQAKSALPAILELLALPYETLDELLGDALTETTLRFLGVLGADHPDLIESMIASRDLNYYVRSAAAGALCVMVRCGTLTREEALERLARQLRAAVESRDQDGVTIVVCRLGILNPLELEAEIRGVFERGLVDEGMIDWDSFQEYDLFPDHAGVCPRLDNEHYQPIGDTVAELRTWHCFSMPSGERSFGRLLENYDDDWDEPLDLDDEDLQDEDYEPVAEPREDVLTIRNDSPRVGRNDPCPCGSGKKYKKCCLKSGGAL